MTRISLNIGTAALVTGEVDAYETPDALLAAVIADPDLIIEIVEHGRQLYVRGSAIRLVMRA